MRLKNLSKQAQTVLDAGDGVGRTVASADVCNFTEQGARELLASFPDIWASDEPATKPAKKAKESP